MIDWVLGVVSNRHRKVAEEHPRSMLNEKNASKILNN